MKAITAGRVVTFLTPIFGAVAGIGSGWLAKHFPGVPTPSPTDILAIEVTVATGAIAAGLKWLHGNSEWERLERLIAAEVPHVESALAPIEKIDPKLVSAVETEVKAEAEKLVEDVAPAAAWPAPAAPASDPQAPAAVTDPPPAAA